MNFIDVCSIIVTFLGGMLTQAVINDNSARTSCRNDLLELENVLEEAAYRSNTEGEDLHRVEKLKQIFRRLDIHQADLLIKFAILKSSLEQSLQHIFKCKKDPNNSMSCPTSEKLFLLALWGEGIFRDYEAKKIKEIRLFLDANILMRLYMRFRQSNFGKGKR